jgi:hypothetical protein
VLWLATTRPDGRPHLTPIWFRFVEGRFWMCATPDAVKVRNLTLQPSCSVAVEGVGRPVVAEGHARLHHRADGPFPVPVVTAFRQGFDWDIDADDEGYTCLVEVEVRRWLYGGPLPDAEQAHPEDQPSTSA